MLFHLIYYMLILNNFQVALTSELTIMGECTHWSRAIVGPVLLNARDQQ